MIATANVGTYGITISQGTLSANGNYAFAFNSAGLLTVNPADDHRQQRDADL